MIIWPEVKPLFREVLSTYAVSVGTTPVQVNVSADAEIILIANMSQTETVYFGNSTVDTTNGFPIFPGQTLIFYKEAFTGDLFFVAANPAEIRIAELR